MTTYCFRCPSGHAFQLNSRSVPGCYECGAEMRRDYRAEGVGIGQGVRVSRDGTKRDFAHLMLPDNDEFKGPGDPDGHKGMRAWRENHSPVDDNRKPYWPGEVQKEQF